MKRIILLISLIIITLVIGYWLYPVYYNSVRHPRFSLITTIECPNGFDRSYYKAVDVVTDSCDLSEILVRYFCTIDAAECPPFDSVVVDSLSRTLDWRHFDYVLSYNRPIDSLYWSPALTDFDEDGVFDLPEIPLYVHFGQDTTHYLYVYKIWPKRRYRRLQT